MSQLKSSVIAACRDLRGAWSTLLGTLLLGMLLTLGLPFSASATPGITLNHSFAGNVNYAVTGGTMRTQPNNVDPCAVQSTSSAAITGVPIGATVKAAYLYYVGNGDTPDYTVTFNGVSVSANTQYNDTLLFQGQNYKYFGGIIDVTTQVGGNGTYTFGGLSTQVTDTPGGALYCTYQGVVAGWSLVVVYEQASEPFRVINIFDGLEHFYGTSITNTPGNFKVPATGIDGKVTIITWGGDPDISNSLNGLTEAVGVNGTTLTDSSNPSNNQYNSTINSQSSTSSWGVDIDTYNVTPYLSPGQTSATVYYGTGADDVYLTAQIVSVTNTPVADLEIAGSHTGDFTAGGSGSYTLAVKNKGPQTANGTTTVTDTLPTGLSYVSASGSGWTCGVASQVVTCTTSASVGTGASLPSITVNVTIAGNATSPLNNVATVSNPTFDNISANNTSTDATTVLAPNLSTSGKSVVDLNGGDANPGDTLRYTITLIETGGAAASGASVTDDIPANTSGFTVVSTPAGSSNASTFVGTGANGTGYLNITGISIPANGSVTVVFDVAVAAGTPIGTQIDNTATVSTPAGVAATPAAGSVQVSQSQVLAAGNKVLYVYDNNTLTRTPQAANSGTPITIDGGANAVWNLTPTVATGKSLVLPAQTVTIKLVTVASGNSTGTARPTVVSLRNGTTTIASSAAQNITGTVTTLRTFTMAIPATTIAAGGNLNLMVANNFSNANRRIDVSQKTAAQGASTVTFGTTTVVNVDSVTIYSAAYGATSTKSSYVHDDVLYVRAVISDPFGSADVSAAKVTITDANGIVKLTAAAMTQVADSGTATRTFEYQYTLPNTVAIGNWTASVTGLEGTEGTVTHTANTAFLVGLPVLSMVKSHSGNFSAGTNAVYSLVVHNNSLGAIAGTTTVTDTLAAGLSYVSATGTGWSCGAVGQLVTCTNAGSVPASSNLPTISLTVAVAGSAGTSIDNQATVSNPNVDGGAGQVGLVDTATIVHPDLSGSTKSVIDINGGDADPGDTLRYTITLDESGATAAASVSVTDDIPANTTAFTVISIPAGSTNSSTSTGGSNNKGYLNITGIAIPASGTVSIVFDVKIAAATTAGTTINNTATVTNPNGAGAAPVAPTVTVSQSQAAQSGNKKLYLYNNLQLSRTPQSQTTAGVTIASVSGSSTWVLTPAIATGKSLVIPAGNVVVTVDLATSGTAATRTVQAQLFNGATQVGSTPQITFNTATPTQTTFTVVLASPVTVAAGATLSLKIINATTTATRPIVVYQYNANPGTVSIITSTVINVDSVAPYSVIYPSNTTSPRYLPGSTVYLRAVISDPFGSFDVHHANITIKDSSGTTIVNNLAMALRADSGVATRTFGYTYTLPNNPNFGAWTATVTGYEGVESVVTHTANGSFNVEGQVTLGKTWSNAIAGDAVSLTIGGGTTATAGTSTAPSTTTAATANSGASTTITLVEAFTTGSSGNYTPTLACSKVSDASVVTVTGTGLSRTFSMPSNSSVTCNWTNTRSVPLTVVKLSQVYSDPVNGTTNPKAIPGAMVDYHVFISNPAANPTDANSVVVDDAVPANVKLYVGNFGAPGSGPVAFINGSPVSGLSYTFTSLASTTDDIAFSNNGGASYVYTPTPDANGVDSTVTNLRINPKGVFNANSAAFQLQFRVRVE